MNTSEEEATKKGCAGCMGCLTVVIGIPWLIMLIVYFCFSKTAEDAVRDVSLQDGLYTTSLTIDDVDSDSRKTKKSYIKHLASEIEKNTGIDISIPIYEVLQKNEKVRELSVKCLQKSDGEGLYAICYEVDGRGFQLQFAARDASLFRKELGSAEYVGGYADDLVRSVGAFYNIPPKGIRALEDLVRPRVPNN